MRIVYRFPRNNVDFLDTLLELLSIINAKALQLNGLPAHEIESALMIYKLDK